MPTAAETRAGEIVRTSKDLAAKLARLASDMRVRARESINAEGGELRKLYNALRETPICDLCEDDFADVCAQTVACGLLSASIATRGGAPTADGLNELVSNTGPFLRELMQTFLNVGSGEVSQLLSRTRMDEVLKDFDVKHPSEDPFTHFYELFLKEYDPERRMKRGVFYTTRPVVNFIVRSVDEILCADFGLEDGLADTTTWGEFVERERIRDPKSTFRIPKGVGPEEPFVQILDPATGTGTFLVEVVERIHATMRAKWARRGKSEPEIRALWNEYVPRHLLPRLHGFELMMAPYAVAHMKLGLKLAETKYRFDSAERARVYLTNTLDEPKDFSHRSEQMSHALAHEVDAANSFKRRAHVTVVIGNPPYSNISQNMCEWIKSLVEDYRLVGGVRIVEKSKRNHLQDDYVKFMRVAHEYVRAAGCGVVGFITNHSYLDSPTFRGMRYSLLSDFDGIRVVNLHGNAKRDQRGLRAGDENVFEIQQGVAITCLSRTPNARVGATRYADLYGTRESKHDFLLSRDITDLIDLAAPLSPKAPFFFLVPEVRSCAWDEYEAGWKVDEFMPFGGAGVKTNRDAFVIDFEDGPLRERMKVFADERVGDTEAESALGLKENYVWKIPKARAAFRRDGDTDRIRDVAYRPFDVRRIYYQKDVVFNPRFETMRQSGRGNLYLLTCRQQYSEGFRHVSVCREMFECCVVSAKSREITSGFPLYVYSSCAEGGQSSLSHERAANYSAEFLSRLETTTGLQFVSDGRGDLRRTVGPEDVLHYVYAVLHSPTYRARYAEFLKVDFPRVPLTSDAELIRTLCALGADLVALHLLEDGYEAASWNALRPESESPLKTRAARFVGGKRAAEVAKGFPVYRDGSVYVNYSGRFEGVTREVWDFQVGGHKVCEKWLKDRRGRALSAEDVGHYCRVVAALGETARLMSEIDRAVEARGGWPLGGKSETRKS